MIADSLDFSFLNPACVSHDYVVPGLVSDRSTIPCNRLV